MIRYKYSDYIESSLSAPDKGLRFQSYNGNFYKVAIGGAGKQIIAEDHLTAPLYLDTTSLKVRTSGGASVGYESIVIANNALDTIQDIRVTASPTFANLILAASVTDGYIQFFDDGLKSVKLLSPAALSSDYAITFPSDPPGEDTYLKHTTGGVYTWAAGGSGGSYTAGDGILISVGDVISAALHSNANLVFRDDTGKDKIDTAQDIKTTSSPAFAGIYLNGTTGSVRLYTTGTVTNYSLTFPTAVSAGNQYLVADASGVFSWVTAHAAVTLNASVSAILALSSQEIGAHGSFEHGDIIWYNTNALARLSKPASNKFLRNTSTGAISWETVVENVNVTVASSLTDIFTIDGNQSLLSTSIVVGGIAYHTGTKWTVLGKPASDSFLKMTSSGVPSWDTITLHDAVTLHSSVGDLFQLSTQELQAKTGLVQGDIVYYNGTKYAILNRPTTGNQLLQNTTTGVLSWVDAPSSISYWTKTGSVLTTATANDEVHLSTNAQKLSFGTSKEFQVYYDSTAPAAYLKVTGTNNLIVWLGTTDQYTFTNTAFISAKNLGATGSRWPIGYFTNVDAKKYYAADLSTDGLGGFQIYVENDEPLTPGLFLFSRLRASGAALVNEDYLGRIAFRNHTDFYHPANLLNIVGIYNSAGSYLEFQQGNTTVFGFTKDKNVRFNGAYSFPTTIGSAGFILKVPSSGTLLEWASSSAGLWEQTQTTFIKPISASHRAMVIYDNETTNPSLTELALGNSHLAFLKKRGSGAVTTADSLGGITFAGFNGTTYGAAFSIIVSPDNTWTTTNHKSTLTIQRWAYNGTSSYLSIGDNHQLYAIGGISFAGSGSGGWQYIFPTATGGTNQVMVNNGIGILSWSGPTVNASVADILQWSGLELQAKTGLASGDIIYYSTKLTRLAKSTDGKILTLVSGLPSWETPSAYSGGDGISITGTSVAAALHSDGNLVFSDDSGKNKINTVQGIKTASTPTFRSLILQHPSDAAVLHLSTISDTATSYIHLGTSRAGGAIHQAGDKLGILRFTASHEGSQRIASLYTVYQAPYKADIILSQWADATTENKKLRVYGTDDANFGKIEFYGQYKFPEAGSGDNGKYLKYDHSSGALVFDDPSSSGSSLWERDTNDNLQLIDQTLNNAILFKAPNSNAQEGTSHYFYSGSDDYPILSAEIIGYRNFFGCSASSSFLDSYAEYILAKNDWTGESDSYSIRYTDLYGTEREKQLNYESTYYYKRISGIYVNASRVISKALNTNVIIRKEMASNNNSNEIISAFQADLVATEDWDTSFGVKYILRTISTGATSLLERFQITGAGSIRFNDAYTFPSTDGSNGQFLQTNGSGTLSWASASGSSKWSWGAINGVNYLYPTDTSHTRVSLYLESNTEYPFYISFKSRASGADIQNTDIIGSYAFMGKYDSEWKNTGDILNNFIAGAEIKYTELVFSTANWDIDDVYQETNSFIVDYTGAYIYGNILQLASQNIHWGSANSFYLPYNAQAANTILYATGNTQTQWYTISQALNAGLSPTASTAGAMIYFNGTSWATYNPASAPTTGHYLQWNGSAIAWAAASGGGGSFTETIISNFSPIEVTNGTPQEFAIDIGVGAFLIDSIMVYSTADGDDVDLDFTIEVYRKSAGYLGAASTHNLEWAFDHFYKEENIKIHNTRLTANESANDTSLAVNDNSFLFLDCLILVDEEEYHRVAALPSTTAITIYADGLDAAQADNDPVWQIYEKNNLGMFYNKSTDTDIYVRISNNDAVTARTFKVIVKATKLA